MLSILLVISIFSLATSLIPKWGILISFIVFVISAICYKKLCSIDFKKKMITTILILSSVSLINSAIFTMVDYAFKDKINIAGSVDKVKLKKIVQEHDSLQNIITFYINSNSSTKDATNLLSKNKAIIFNSEESIKHYPEEIKAFIATTNSRTIYYPIKFELLNYNLFLTNKDNWLIDKKGNVYFNIENLNNY